MTTVLDQLRMPTQPEQHMPHPDNDMQLFTHATTPVDVVAEVATATATSPADTAKTDSFQVAAQVAAQDAAPQPKQAPQPQQANQPEQPSQPGLKPFTVMTMPERKPHVLATEYVKHDLAAAPATGPGRHRAEATPLRQRITQKVGALATSVNAKFTEKAQATRPAEQPAKASVDNTVSPPDRVSKFASLRSAVKEGWGNLNTKVGTAAIRVQETLLADSKEAKRYRIIAAVGTVAVAGLYLWANKGTHAGGSFGSNGESDLISGAPKAPDTAVTDAVPTQPSVAPETIPTPDVPTAPAPPPAPAIELQFDTDAATPWGSLDGLFEDKQILGKLEDAAKASGLPFEWHDADADRWLELTLADGTKVSDTPSVMQALGKYITK